MANVETVAIDVTTETAAGVLTPTVGMIFRTYDEMFKVITDFGKANNTLFIKGDTRKLPGCGPDRNEYQFITFVCKQGGKLRPSSSRGLRPNQSTLKCGCPVKIRACVAKYDELGESLGYRITHVNMEHNHETSEIIYSAYPENRRVLMTETVEALLSCPGISTKDLKKHIHESQGKVVLSSDIRNLKIKAGIQMPTRKRRSSLSADYVEVCPGDLPTKEEPPDPLADHITGTPTKAAQILSTSDVSITSSRGLEKYIKNQVKRKKPRTEEEAKYMTQKSMNYGCKTNQTTYETPDGEKYTIIQLANSEDADPDLEFFKGILPQVKELKNSRKREFFLAVSSLLFQSLDKQDQEVQVDIKPELPQVFNVVSSDQPHVVAVEVDPKAL